MSIVIEIILEVILLGTIDAIPSKRVPLIVRVRLAIILLTAYIGLALLMFIAGVQSKNTMLVAVAGIVLFLVAALIFPKLKRIKSK